MAQLVFSYPFTLEPGSGSFVKVEQGTDLYKGQNVAAFLQTLVNERSVTPDFGIDDPTFSDFDAPSFTEKFQGFYADSIVLQEIEVVQEAGALAEINVSFD